MPKDRFWCRYHSLPASYETRLYVRVGTLISTWPPFGGIAQGYSFDEYPLVGLLVDAYNSAIGLLEVAI